MPFTLQETLLQVLQILLKVKLLVCDDDENDLRPSSALELFFGYKKYERHSMSWNFVDVNVEYRIQYFAL
jgi:hypothetical protein